MNMQAPPGAPIIVNKKGPSKLWILVALVVICSVSCMICVFSFRETCNNKGTPLYYMSKDKTGSIITWVCAGVSSLVGMPCLLCVKILLMFLCA